MSSPELTMLRGHLARAERDFAELDILVDGDIILIRQMIDPYEQNKCALRVDEALAAMSRLKTNVHRMRELHEQISKLKDDLGER